MPDTQELSHIAGYVAAAPEIKQGRDRDGNPSEFTTFRIGVNVGYGEESETKWFGVAVNNPDLQDYVNGTLRKGTPVVCEGVARTVERNGSIFNNFNAYRIGVVDWFVRGRAQSRKPEEEDL